MKIFVIGPIVPYRGGCAHYNTLLCDSLSKENEIKAFSFKRLFPRFLFPGKNQKDLDSKVNIKFENEEILDSINPFNWIKFFLLVRKEKPDIVMFYWWTPFFAPMDYFLSFMIKNFTKAKLLMFCHNVLPHERRFVDKFLTKLVFKRFDRFIVQSTEDERNLIEMIPNVNVKKVKHPNYSFFKINNYSKKEAKKRLNLRGNIILFFGFIRPYKGLRVLLKSLSLVLKKKDIKLLIVGEFFNKLGERKEDYLKEIDKLGIKDKVIIIDKYVPNEEVDLYFSASDLVIVPYLSATGCGITQVALGLEKPVIGTDKGDMPDIIINGKTGYIVKAGDYNEMAEAILKFYKENKEKEFINNIKIENKNLTWKKVVDVITS